MGLRADGDRRRPATSSSTSGAAPTPTTGVRRRSRQGDMDAQIRRVIPEADASYLPIAGVGTTLYLLTDRDAPRGEVVALDVDDPDAELREIISEVPTRSSRSGWSAIGSRSSRSTTPTIGSPSSRPTGATSPTWRCRRSARSPAWRYGARIPRPVPDVHDLRRPGRVLAVRMADGKASTVGGSRVALGPVRLRHRAGLRRFRGRYAVPLFLTHRRDVEPDGRTVQPCCTATAASRSGRRRPSSPS